MFSKDAYYSHWVLFSWHPFPKAPSPCAIVLEVRGSTYEFYEDINTQPIVASFEISLECTLLPQQACQQNVLSL